MHITTKIKYHLNDNDADAINKVMDICETLQEKFEEIDESFADTLDTIIQGLHDLQIKEG